MDEHWPPFHQLLHHWIESHPLESSVTQPTVPTSHTSHLQLALNAPKHPNIQNNVHVEERTWYLECSVSLGRSSIQMKRTKEAKSLSLGLMSPPMPPIPGTQGKPIQVHLPGLTPIILGKQLHLGDLWWPTGTDRGTQQQPPAQVGGLNQAKGLGWTKIGWLDSVVLMTPTLMILCKEHPLFPMAVPSENHSSLRWDHCCARGTASPWYLSKRTQLNL